MIALGLAACAGGDGGGDAGDTTCAAFEPCGGDIVGSWTIQELCSADFVQIVRAGIFQPECLDGVKSVEAQGHGTETFTAAGANTSSRMLTLQYQTVWTRACLEAKHEGQAIELSSACAEAAQESLAAPQVASSSCAVVGDACECIGTMQALITRASTYETSGSELRIDGLPHEYCVSGDTLRVLEHTLDAETSLTLVRSAADSSTK